MFNFIIATHSELTKASPCHHSNIISSNNHNNNNDIINNKIIIIINNNNSFLPKVSFPFPVPQERNRIWGIPMQFFLCESTSHATQMPGFSVCVRQCPPVCGWTGWTGWTGDKDVATFSRNHFGALDLSLLLCFVSCGRVIVSNCLTKYAQ